MDKVKYGLFQHSRQEILRQIVQYGRNLNLSEIFCLSWIPARFNKLRSELKALCPAQGQVCAFQQSRQVALR